MTFGKIHRAVCSGCGYVEKRDDSGTFIDKFFLPGMCQGCGADMPSRYGSSYRIEEGKPHWLHVIEKQQYVPAVRTRNPLTWLRMGHWETIETTTHKA